MGTDWIVLVLLTCAASLALVDLIGPAPVEDDEPACVVDDVTSAATLEFWSHIFAANNFSARVTFQQFMSNPRGYVSAKLFPLDQDDPLELLPLLPEQQVVRARVLFEEQQLAEQLLLAQQRAEERAAAEEAQLQRLERAYSEISTNGNRLCAPMRRVRSPKKWKTRGANLHPDLA
jgi:hypothetical protein